MQRLIKPSLTTHIRIARSLSKMLDTWYRCNLEFSAHATHICGTNDLVDASQIQKQQWPHSNNLQLPARISSGFFPYLWVQAIQSACKPVCYRIFSNSKLHFFCSSYALHDCALLIVECGSRTCKWEYVQAVRPLSARAIDEQMACASATQPHSHTYTRYAMMNGHVEKQKNKNIIIEHLFSVVAAAFAHSAPHCRSGIKTHGHKAAPLADNDNAHQFFSNYSHRIVMCRNFAERIADILHVL